MNPFRLYALRRFRPLAPLSGTVALLLSAHVGYGQTPTPAEKLKKPAAESLGTTTMSEVVVSAQAPATAYHAEEATTATRLPERILDTPRSVQVVPKEVLRDRAVNDPQEAVQNVSGTVRGASFNGVGETFIIRGFQQDELIKDGFRDGVAANAGLAATGPTDMANIDRVEVLKGPSAILYGRGEPGGTVNYITKTPVFENHFSLQQSVGSYDFYRTELNANWNAVPDRFALRIDAAYDRNESFIDYVEGERWFVAPSFQWRITPDTILTFRGEYSHDDRSETPGLPYAKGQVIPNVPYNRYFGDPGFTDLLNENWRGLIQLEHRWTDWAKTTVSVNGRTASQEGAHVVLYNFTGGPLQDPVTGAISRAVAMDDHKDKDITVRLDQLFEWTIYDGGTKTTEVMGKDGKSIATTTSSGFPTVKNQLLISGEFERFTADHFRDLHGMSSLIPLHPQYPGYQALPLVPGFPVDIREFTDSQADAWSLLLMDHLSVGDTVHLSFGGRVEWFDAQNNLNYPDPGVPFAAHSSDQHIAAFVPSVGLVVKPARNFSVYGSYSESTNTFLNAFATPTVDGSSLDPERSRQFEVGAKAELFDKRLMASIAFFQIEKKNVVGADPNNPLFSINSGEERSRGFEFDISGEILPGWRVMANYAYIDARIVDAPLGVNVGNRRWGVPENSGGIFTTYEVQEGALRGLGIGGGVYLADRVKVDNTNLGSLSGYAQTDLVVYYRRDHWRAQVNVKNLFDNEFYYATGTSSMVQPANARTIIASLKYEF